MAGLDSNLGASWLYDYLIADSVLNDLLGAEGNIYRDEATDNPTLPYVVVSILSTRPGVGWIQEGPRTNWATPVTVTTTIWDLDNYDRIDPIGGRIIDILDGIGGIEYNGGEMICCSKGTDLPRSVKQGEDTLKGWDIFWDVDAKA